MSPNWVTKAERSDCLKRVLGLSLGLSLGLRLGLGLSLGLGRLKHEGVVAYFTDFWHILEWGNVLGFIISIVLRVIFVVRCQGLRHRELG